LVFEVLRYLKTDPARARVDELKPEGGVFLLLLYLDFERTADFLRRHCGIAGDLLRAADPVSRARALQEAFLRSSP
ncbi:MAG: hypothetical protein ACJ8G7_21515, partial [Rhizobacter sp.]